jgi:high-affinity iron transporter
VLETFVITLRESIEAAIVLAIILAYLDKTQRKNLKQVVYWAIAASVVASIITAIILLGLKSELGAFFEGLLYFIAALFIASMIVFMHGASKHMRENINDKFEKTIDKWRAVGVFALAFFMIYREGAEIILFLSATISKTSAFAVVEFAAALILAVLFAYFFIKGSLKINMKRFFQLTSIMLIILVVQLVLEGLHEWEEQGIIKLGAAATAALDAVSSSTAHSVFSVIIFAFLILLFGLVLFSREKKKKK